MTGYGFTGPMTAMGTVFDAKEEAGDEGQRPRAMRYRFAYQLTDVVRMLLCWV